jgi:predicted enzyme related to lactoylglutathione lyase
MSNPVVHFEILGPEGLALVSFYRELFGWNLRATAMAGYRNYSFLPTPAVGIGGGVGQLESGDQAFVTIYVEVADPQALLDQAVGAGAQVVLAVTELPGVGAIARFRDPQGNVVGLVRSAAPG